MCGTWSPRRSSARSLGVSGVVDPVERRQRLHLGADGDAEDVRVGLAVLDQGGQGLLGVGEGFGGASGEQPDVGAGGMQDADQEAVGFQRGGELQPAGQLGLRLGHAALLVVPAGDVVARERLLPAVAVEDRELERVGEALAEVGDAEVAEHRARHPPREDLQGEVVGVVGDRDGGVGLLQRLGVGAGEERQQRLQRRQLAARGRALGGVAFGLAGQRERGLEVTVVERDQALQGEGPAVELGVLVGEPLDPAGDVAGAGGVLPVPGASVVELAVRRDSDGDGHATGLSAAARET